MCWAVLVCVFERERDTNPVPSSSAHALFFMSGWRGQGSRCVRTRMSECPRACAHVHVTGRPVLFPAETLCSSFAFTIGAQLLHLGAAVGYELRWAHVNILSDATQGILMSPRHHGIIKLYTAAWGILGDLGNLERMTAFRKKRKPPNKSCSISQISYSAICLWSGVKWKHSFLFPSNFISFYGLFSSRPLNPWQNEEQARFASITWAGAWFEIQSSCCN